MSQLLDERAQRASAAVRSAAAIRPRPESLPTARANARPMVLTLAVVIAVTVGAFIVVRDVSTTNESAAGPVTTVPTVPLRYRASAVLLAATRRPAPDVETGARLLTIGAVPERAAAALNLAGEQARLVAQLHIVADPKLGTITMSTDQVNAKYALRVVNTFGEQLVRYLAEFGRATGKSGAALSPYRLIESTNGVRRTP